MYYYYYYYYFVCHPTIADESTYQYFTQLYDASAIDTYVYTLRGLLSVPSKCVLLCYHVFDHLVYIRCLRYTLESKVRP